MRSVVVSCCDSEITAHVIGVATGVGDSGHRVGLSGFLGGHCCADRTATANPTT